LTVDIDRVIVDIDRLTPRPVPMNHQQRQTVFLRRAIELAVENASAGQLPFGALVV
jgi:hypothetical protein